MGTLRRALLATTALTTAAVLATPGAAAAAVPTVESTTERVLQSVSVSMGPDGTTTGVGSSVVRAEDSVEDADTEDATYAPQDVVGDLPVRVLTSWRTAEGAGTDLSDLQGYDGRVAIDVTVQNLTVKPEVLTYDAAGSARQQAALVGSPLTVTASTLLGDLKPERVVSDDRGSGRNVTNGVIGRSADGTTVQWAALLAPPILGSSTELSLVVDAKNFDVPTIDLSVQPGLVTDPSMGAVVDAAFNPAGSSELELQQRTIKLIGEVNLVLARASKTITDVRSSLTTTAETLGTQTVADLQASTQTVASNMSSLDGALQGLQGDLSSTLESTGSSAVAELDQAVSAVDRMLGDTSAQPPTVQVDGNGCRTTVPDPKQANTVYGSLLQVASQLDGYARATDACKAEIKAAIDASIGPDFDDASSQCTDESTSVTCSLYGARSTFEEIAQNLRSLTRATIEILDPALYTEAVQEAQDLQDAVAKVVDYNDAIFEGRLHLLRPVQEARAALADGGPVAVMADEVAAALDQIHANASTVQQQVVEAEEADRSAAQALCDLVADGRMDQQDARNVRDLLVDHQCNQDPGPVPTSAELQSVLDATDTTPEPEDRVGAAKELVELRSGMTRTSAALQAALDHTYDVQGGILLPELLEELNEEVKNLRTQQQELDRAVNGLNRDYETIKQDLQTAVEDAINETDEEIGGKIEPVIREVHGAGVEAREELGTMLETSSSGLSKASDTVVRDGRSTLKEQKSDFFAAQEQAGNRISGTIEDGLGRINQGVSSSTRDMEAATTLLIADLRKVLLDLGDRRVGGGGLLGAMATNAATARTADFQLALAGDKATSYANVRGRDIEGLQLRQAQTEAAMQMLLDLPAFQLDLPSGSQHRTVYSFTIEDS